MNNRLLTGIAIALFIIAAATAFLLAHPPTSPITPQDIESPTIEYPTGNLTAKPGETVTISAFFSDDIAITDPLLHYRPSTADRYSTKSMNDGNANISIPSDANENWYYYITVDDSAHHGPVGDPSADGTKYYTISINTTTPPPDDNGTDTNNTDNGGDTNTSLPHAFIEVATKTVCPECPKITALLQDLEHTTTTPFYYVTMPQENNKTADRFAEYNTYGYPTLYIDGGSTVLVSSNVEKTAVESALQQELSRPHPNITITLTATHRDNTTMNVTTTIKNNDPQPYQGTLRVYLTEIISTTFQENTPYHYSFLTFVQNENLTITANDTITRTTPLTISGLDSENLKLFAVLFNASGTQGFSRPPDKNPFLIHQVDATTATTVVAGGNLPPMVGIQSPKIKTRNILGNERRDSILGKTILIGATPITATASDDGNITKVEFYIDGKLKATMNTTPYTWTWHQFAIGKHTITVKAYDDAGKSSSASLDVLVIMKWPGLLSHIRGRN